MPTKKRASATKSARRVANRGSGDMRPSGSISLNEAIQRGFYEQQKRISDHVRARPASVLYRLELTEGQCGVLMEACEFFARINMGQFDEISSLFRMRSFAKDHKTPEWDSERADEAERALRVAKRILTGLDSNAYFGIGGDGISDQAKIAMEMRDVVRHRLSYDRHPAGGHTTNFNTPMLWSGKEPLAKIEKAGVAQGESAEGQPTASEVVGAKPAPRTSKKERKKP